MTLPEMHWIFHLFYYQTLLSISPQLYLWFVCYTFWSSVTNVLWRIPCRKFEFIPRSILFVKHLFFKSSILFFSPNSQFRTTLCQSCEKATKCKFCGYNSENFEKHLQRYCVCWEGSVVQNPQCELLTPYTQCEPPQKTGACQKIQAILLGSACLLMLAILLLTLSQTLVTPLREALWWSSTSESTSWPIVTAPAAVSIFITRSSFVLLHLRI